MIYILDKNEEVVGVLSNQSNSTDTTPFFNDKHLLDLDNGSESYQFDTLGDAPESEYLEVGNLIAFDYEGVIKLFSIMSVEETHEDAYIKNVYAESCGLELLNNYFRPTKFTNVTVKQFAEQLLINTSFKLGTVSKDLQQIRDIDITSHTSIYKAIQDFIIKEFNCEISFRVNIANNKIVARYLDIYDRLGKESLHRFEYGVNMSKVVRTVDMSDVCTALIGVGKDNLDFKNVSAKDKPLHVDYLVNNDAYRRFNIRGRHIFGIYEYDTDNADELLRATRLELENRGIPKVTYDLEVQLLDDDVRLGDTVYVIDNAFNPPLQVEARVKTLELSYSDSASNRCTLSNFKEVKSNITNDMRALANKLVYVEKNVKEVDGLKEKIEKLQVGGRNLLLDSIRKVTNDSYPTAIFTLSQIEKYKEGAEYTLSIQGELGEGKTSWDIYNSGGSLRLCQITDADRRENGRYVKTFKWIKGQDLFINVYAVSNSVKTASTIEWVKLESGNVGTSHSYAQEDLDKVVEDKINHTQTILNQNITNAVDTATTNIKNDVDKKISDTKDAIDNKIDSTVNDATTVVKLDFNKKIEDTKTAINSDITNAVNNATDNINSSVDDKITNTELSMNSNIDNAIQSATDDIMSTVEDVYAPISVITELQSDVSSQIEQTNENIEISFNRVNDYTVKVGEQLNNYKEEIKTHIRFSEEGMELGKVDSPFSATLDNEKLAFLENNKEVAYISNNKMHITQAEVSKSLRIGEGSQGFFTWRTSTNGNLSLKWTKS